TGAARNIVSGNARVGIAVNGGNVVAGGTHNNVVLGNYVGTDVTGTKAVPNGVGTLNPGVSINRSSNSVIGNLISGNASYSLTVASGTTDTIVQGNLIGTNAAGTAALANGGPGINVSGGSNTIGGTTAVARNVIAGNTGDGVQVTGASNLIEGNYIGTDVTGTVALANTGNGVAIPAGAQSNPNRTNRDGVNDAAEGNTIAFNTKVGVLVLDASSTGNSIRGNAIFSNGGLGIDLGNDGVTPNDPGDADAGPNNLQNFPVLIAATPG